jgi:hypothetical protein
MSQPRSSILLGLLLAVAAPARAAEAAPPSEPAGGKHCLGETRTKLLLSEGLYAQTSPLGVEDILQLGVCTPLIRTPGALFDYTNLQAGAVVHLSPVYAMPGLFVSVAPLSVLELRADVESVRTWTIGMDAAGYFPLASAGEQFKDPPAARARAVSGYNATFTGTLQLEVDLAERWTLAAVDSLSYAHWHLGAAPFYYNPQYNLPMARSDWIGRNMAILLVGHTLSDRFKLQAGVTDELTWVATSGARANILAALLTGVISRWPGEGRETQPFLRVGGYTEHAFRKGELQVLGGIGVTFDVTPGRPPRAR